MQRSDQSPSNDQNQSPSEQSSLQINQSKYTSESHPLHAVQQQPHTEDQLSPLEKLLEKVGGEGTYQYRSFMVFNLLWFVTGWLLLGEAFFFSEEYECANPLYDTKQACEAYVCSIESPKERIKQISSHDNSIPFAFKDFLICELDYIVTILQSMIFIGSLIGFFFIPYLADNRGRLMAMKISWLICTLGVAIIGLASSPSMVGVGYFLAGFGANPAITLCYSFINEQCLGKSRQRYGVIIQVFYAFGEATIGLLFIDALGISWREIFYIVFGLAVVVNLLIWVFLIETPKFLIKKSEVRTLKALNKIAKANKCPKVTIEQVMAIDQPLEIDIDENEQISSDSSDEDLGDIRSVRSVRSFISESDSEKSFRSKASDSSKRSLPLLNSLIQKKKSEKGKEQTIIVDQDKVIKINSESASIVLLFKYRSLIWITLGTGAGFLGIQVIYYCTSFNLDQAGYGKLINQEIIGVSEIFGYISGEIIIDKVSRKKVSIYGMAISSAMCMVLALTNIFETDENESILKIVGVVGLILNRFVLCSFWAVFYVYIAELYPTKVRSLGFGWASAMGTVGSTLSPYIIYFSKQIGLNSWILPGLIGFLTITLMFKLPETFGKPMKDQIPEQEEQSKQILSQSKLVH